MGVCGSVRLRSVGLRLVSVYQTDQPGCRTVRNDLGGGAVARSPYCLKGEERERRRRVTKADDDVLLVG